MTCQGAGDRLVGPLDWRRRDRLTLPIIVANARRPWANPWPTNQAAVDQVRAAWAPVLAAIAHQDDVAIPDPCEEGWRA